MAIKHKEFPLRKITFLEYKQIEMDRVLTLFFPRLKWDGHASRRPARNFNLTVDEFTKEFLEMPQWFTGFKEHPQIVRKWIETDLMDLVNRGKVNEAVAAPRPLHGNTYKFRNTQHARDYGAAQQLYGMLYFAHQGQAARDRLRSFFFKGIDLNTDKYDPQVTVDVETQALLRLDEQVNIDMRDPKDPERYSPLFKGNADLLADDVIRLLSYENYIPRSVLVDYVKILFSFHLALYHLRLFKILPQLVQQRGHNTAFLEEGPLSQPPAPINSPHQIGLVVEMGNPENSHMIELAQRSAELYYRRIPEYIRAHFILKKLDEFADYLTKGRGKIAVPAAGHFSITDLLEFMGDTYRAEREGFFNSRLAHFIEEAEDLDPEARQVTELGLSDFETYIEILVALRAAWHRKYIVDCIDSLLLKNNDTGLLKQASARGSTRYFSMGSRLLEVLLQIAVLDPRPGCYTTREIRVDELLQFLRERYNLYIDRLPTHDGFDEPNIVDQYALRKNVTAFKKRLREIGFLQDLSDAYITQTVTPRYTIVAETSQVDRKTG